MRIKSDLDGAIAREIVAGGVDLLLQFDVKFDANLIIRCGRCRQRIKVFFEVGFDFSESAKLIMKRTFEVFVFSGQL